MEIELTVNVPATYLFAGLVAEVVDDVTACIGRSIHQEELPNFSYRRVLPNGRLVHTQITACQAARYYAYTRRYGRTTMTVTYLLRPVTDQVVALTYRERRNVAGRLMNRLTGLVQRVQRVTRRRRLVHQLAAVEAAYAAQT